MIKNTQAGYLFRNKDEFWQHWKVIWRKELRKKEIRRSFEASSFDSTGTAVAPRYFYRYRYRYRWLKKKISHYRDRGRFWKYRFQACFLCTFLISSLSSFALRWKIFYLSLEIFNTFSSCIYMLSRSTPAYVGVIVFLWGPLAYIHSREQGKRDWRSRQESSRIACGKGQRPLVVDGVGRGCTVHNNPPRAVIARKRRHNS